MKKTLKSYFLGFLSATVLVSGISYAASTSTLYNVVTGGVKIYVDGHKLNPKDANGNAVEPIIYNGTTYLPVRAVANALGKPVYWDGPSYTVYLGDMDGNLQHPSVSLIDVDNIGDPYDTAAADKLKDNYGNEYSNAIYRYNGTFKAILNMQYSHFRCTLYTPKGASGNDTRKILIKVDGRTIFTSPEITTTSRPVNVDLDIRGCNIFEIETIGGHGQRTGYIGDAGFYQ